jgi:hypothetical protein
MAQTISLMVPTQSQIRSKAFAMSMNKEALTGTNLAYSTRSMALVWMLDAPETGADYMFSFEGGICRSGQTSASAQQEGPAPCRCEPNIKERRVLVAATCEHNFGGGTGRMR